MGRRDGSLPPLPPLAAGDEPLLDADALFLGHFTARDLDAALRSRGILDALARRGHADARVVVERDAAGATRVRLLAGAHALGEVRARHELWRGHKLVAIDFLEARDPRAAFTRERPQLPGQSAPGLGVGRGALELLATAARTTGAEGLLAHPQHYHNAVLYARAGFVHVDPEAEGRVRALARALAGLSLAEASWAVERGEVRDLASGAPVEWAKLAGDLVLLLTRAARAELDRPGREAVARRAEADAAYRLSR